MTKSERDLPDRGSWREEIREALWDTLRARSAEVEAVLELVERAYNCGFEHAQETISEWHKP